MPLPLEVRADFDRLRGLLDTARDLPDDVSGEANSMIYEYLCVAIVGRLEQNIKQILIQYSNNKSNTSMGAPVSRLCQGFQNPDKVKILSLLELFDRDFSRNLDEKWKEEGSIGNVISDMVGLRKIIAHQTTSSRNATQTKVEGFYKAYKAFVEEMGQNFLG